MKFRDIYIYNILKDPDKEAVMTERKSERQRERGLERKTRHDVFK